MALELEKTTKRNADEIMDWLHQNLQQSLDRKVASQKLKVTFLNEEKKVLISNKKIKGEIIVKNNYLKGTLELPLLYRAFGGTIKSAINSILKELW